MNEILEEKLNKLREKAKDPNVDKESFDSFLNDCEKEIERSRLLEEYREFELSKQITKLLTGILMNINRHLINEDEAIKRSGLKADKERCEWLLRIYSEKPDNILNSIEAQVDVEIEKLNL